MFVEGYGGGKRGKSLLNHDCYLQYLHKIGHTNVLIVGAPQYLFMAIDLYEVI